VIVKIHFAKPLSAHAGRGFVFLANKSQTCTTFLCGSGRAREAGDAVYGTGFAGVRGSTPRLARTHNSYSERAIPSCENIPVTFT
ncbi:hypothetical protein QVM32_27480, partial [Pseudomonas asiatica]|nr:hypothetical protein [Pseudomonas shirazica]